MIPMTLKELEDKVMLLEAMLKEKELIISRLEKEINRLGVDAMDVKSHYKNREKQSRGL
jgi:hypothetical protein